MLREGVFVTSVGTQSAAQMFVVADHLLVRVVHALTETSLQSFVRLTAACVIWHLPKVNHPGVLEHI
jgi:hypothetical protein